MKQIIILLFTCLVLFVSAQTNEIDSLKNKLQKTDNTIEKLDILRKIGQEFIRINYDSSLYYSFKELDYALAINDTLHIAFSKHRIGKIYNKRGKYQEALEFLNEAAYLFKSGSDTSFYATVLTDISEVYKLKGDYNKSLEMLITARKLCRSIKDDFEEARVLNKIARIYLSMDQNDKAIDYYQYALDIMIKKDYKPAISALYNNIGCVYMERTEGELDTIRKLDYCKQAEVFLFKALPIKKEINDLKGLTSCLINIGLNYNAMHEYSLAENYLLQAEELCNKTKDMANLYTAYQNLSIVYITINKYSKALLYAEKVYNADKTGEFKLDIVLKEANHGILYNIYKKLNDLDKALYHLEEQKELRDSMYNVDLVKSVNELDLKYQTKLKEQENEILLKENNIQKLQIQKRDMSIITLIILLSSTLLLAGVILLYIRHRRLKAQQQNVLLEQRLLRSQMNPHFIFNSLTAVQAYILQSEPAEGARYLSKFAALMRTVLVHSGTEYVFFEKEVEALRYYLDLQMLRYDNKFDYEIIVDDNIQLDNCLIPPMLAQPFIENAIEHGIAPSDKKGVIKISFKKNDEDSLEFRVEDNGVGLSNKSENRNSEGHYSMATKITKKRLELLNRRKKEKIQLQVTEKFNSNNESEGVLTIFRIPVKKQ